MFSSRRALAISAAVLCALGIAFLLARVVGGEQRVWSLAGNTLLLATHTCLVSLPIGTLLAFLIVRTDLPGRQFVAVAVGAMLFIPLYIQAAAWDAGFGQLGWYSMAGGTMAKPILSGWWAVVWIHGTTAVPWVVLIVGAGLRLVEPELEEEALLFGSHWQVFRHVTLVRMMAYVGVAALWILISTTCEMTVTNLYRVPTLTEIVYMELPYVDSLGEAGLTTLPLALVVGSLAVVSLVIVAAVAPPASSASMRPPRTIRLGRLRAWATVVVCALLLLVVVAPLDNLQHWLSGDVGTRDSRSRLSA